MRLLVATLPELLTRSMSPCEKLPLVLTLPLLLPVRSALLLEKLSVLDSVPLPSLFTSPAASLLRLPPTRVTATAPPMPTVPPPAAAAAVLFSVRDASASTVTAPVT